MVVDTQLYDILGVQPDIDERGLKKAFMKKARDTHPDKHKDDPDATEKFQKVNEAYEILKDPQKREIYDKYGVEGLREGAGQSAGFEDILSHQWFEENPKSSSKWGKYFSWSRLFRLIWVFAISDDAISLLGL